VQGKVRRKDGTLGADPELFEAMFTGLADVFRQATRLEKERDRDRQAESKTRKGDAVRAVQTTASLLAIFFALLTLKRQVATAGTTRKEARTSASFMFLGESSRGRR
jgi:SHS2 domain-containing protein